jgi:hypothetical protein
MFGTSGDLSMQYGAVSTDPQGNPGGAFGGFARLAAWPDDTDCLDVGGIRVPFDPDAQGAQGAVVAEALSAFEDAHPIELVWSDSDGSSDLTLTLEPTAASACLQFPGDSSSPVAGPAPVPGLGDAPYFSVGASLHASTVDGRLDHDYGVRAIVVTTTNDEFQRLLLVLDDECGFFENASGFPAACGDFPVDVSTFDAVVLNLDAELTTPQSGPVIDGELRVYGVTEPECPEPDPGSNSAPGCAGSQSEQLIAVPFMTQAQ